LQKKASGQTGSVFFTEKGSRLSDLGKKMFCNLPDFRLLLASQVRFAMTQVSKNSENSAKSTADGAVDGFVGTLTIEHKMLVVLKAQLYGGKWATMLDDLENRLEGKPYIFRLSSRIKDDVQRIKQLKRFEDKHGVDLADYVELS
jgi:hypothetical protein